MSGSGRWPCGIELVETAEPRGRPRLAVGQTTWPVPGDLISTGQIRLPHLFVFSGFYFFGVQGGNFDLTNFHFKIKISPEIERIKVGWTFQINSHRHDGLQRLIYLGFPVWWLWPHLLEHQKNSRWSARAWQSRADWQLPPGRLSGSIQPRDSSPVISLNRKIIPSGKEKQSPMKKWKQTWKIVVNKSRKETGKNSRWWMKVTSWAVVFYFRVTSLLRLAGLPAGRPAERM